MRVVPRENESINEIWIADRDRFSYEGIYSPDRLQRPLLREGGGWVESDWEPALMRVAEGLRERAASLGVLASSCATIEELYLAARIARGLGSHNIDHRLRQRDFRDQAADPVFPGLGHAHRRRGCAECAGHHRLEPAPRGADPRAPRAQGRPARARRSRS